MSATNVPGEVRFPGKGADPVPSETVRRLEGMLREAGADFVLLYRETPTRSAAEGAAAFRIEPGQTAPALVLEGEGRPLVWIASGGRGRLDLEEAARILGVSSVRLASPGRAKEVTGFVVGSLPLLPHDLPCVVDEELLRYPRVYGGTGDPLWTLAVAPEALLRLNRVVARHPAREGGGTVEQGLPLEAYLATGTEEDRALYRGFRERIRASEAFRERVLRAGILPDLEVYAELFCPDCAVLVPYLEEVAAWRPEASLRFFPREGNEERLCALSGEARIPTVVARGRGGSRGEVFLERPRVVRELLAAASGEERVRIVSAYRNGAFATVLEEELGDLLTGEKGERG